VAASASFRVPGAGNYHPDPEMTPTIVVGWDGSAEARAALSAGVRLASGGQLVAVHAHQAATPHVSARWQQLLQEDAAERSRALLGELDASAEPELAGIDVELRSMDGRPVPALLKAADDVDADAIAVGTRGVGETTTSVGSVALGLVQVSKPPVLVVPPPRPA
jgi:nucleotide-binding universal stress UspA family protein